MPIPGHIRDAKAFPRKRPSPHSRQPAVPPVGIELTTFGLKSRICRLNCRRYAWFGQVVSGRIGSYLLTRDIFRDTVSSSSSSGRRRASTSSRPGLDSGANRVSTAVQVLAQEQSKASSEAAVTDRRGRSVVPDTLRGCRLGDRPPRDRRTRCRLGAAVEHVGTKIDPSRPLDRSRL